MAEVQVKPKQVYKKPESREEATMALENLSGKVYNRLKGRVLAAVESIYDSDKTSSKFVTFKNALDLHLSTVTKGIKNEVTDCLSILNQ